MHKAGVTEIADLIVISVLVDVCAALIAGVVSVFVYVYACAAVSVVGITGVALAVCILVGVLKAE